VPSRPVNPYRPIVRGSPGSSGVTAPSRGLPSMPVPTWPPRAACPAPSVPDSGDEPGPGPVASVRRSRAASRLYRPGVTRLPGATRTSSSSGSDTCSTAWRPGSRWN